MGQKIVGKLGLVTERVRQSFLFQSNNLACGHCGDGSQTQRFPGQGSLAAEFVRPPDCDNDFFATRGIDGDFNLAPVDVKNGVCRVSLRVDHLIRSIIRYARSHGFLTEKSHDIE